MISLLSLSRVLALVAVLASPVWAATDDEIVARRVALDLAGAFSNEGFKLRDGCWQGPLELKQGQVIQVNLYAGNQYWFSLGTTATGKKLRVSVHDEAGKPLAVEPYNDESKAAAGFAPQVSGPYFVRIEMLDGEPTSFCLLYSYK